MVVVDSADSTRNTIYIGSYRSSAKTTNGGSTWTLISLSLQNFAPLRLPYVHDSIHFGMIVTSSTNARVLVLGSNGGLSLSYDAGASFANRVVNVGLVSQLVQSLVVSLTDSDAMLMSLPDIGTLEGSISSDDFNVIYVGTGAAVATSTTTTILSAYPNQYPEFPGPICVVLSIFVWHGHQHTRLWGYKD